MATKNKVPNLYACGTMNIQGKMLLVDQVSNKGEQHIKLPGGTFMGPYEKWKARGEELNHYYIHLEKEVELKIISSLQKAFGSFASNEVKNQFSEITQLIMKFINKGNEKYDNPIAMQYAKTHLVIEWIEELGIIPMEVIFLCSTQHGDHTKYAFEVTSAIIFSSTSYSGKGGFIDLKAAADIPERGIDFVCADFEVIKTILLSEAQTRTLNFAHGIHSNARDVMFLNWERQSS